MCGYLGIYSALGVAGIIAELFRNAGHPTMDGLYVSPDNGSSTIVHLLGTK